MRVVGVKGEHSTLSLVQRSARYSRRFSVIRELAHSFLDDHIDHMLPVGGMHTSHAAFVWKLLSSPLGA